MGVFYFYFILICLLCRFASVVKGSTWSVVLYSITASAACREQHWREASQAFYRVSIVYSNLQATMCAGTTPFATCLGGESHTHFPTHTNHISVYRAALLLWWFVNVDVKIKWCQKLSLVDSLLDAHWMCCQGDDYLTALQFLYNGFIRALATKDLIRCLRWETVKWALPIFLTKITWGQGNISWDDTWNLCNTSWRIGTR